MMMIARSVDVDDDANASVGRHQTHIPHQNSKRPQPAASSSHPNFHLRSYSYLEKMRESNETARVVGVVDDVGGEK